MLFEERIKNAWYTETSKSYCQSLIYYMPDNIATIIKNEGSTTKYIIYLNNHVNVFCFSI